MKPGAGHVLLAALVGSLLAVLPSAPALAASGTCYLIGQPADHELSVTDLADTDPATNETTIGWSGDQVSLGPAAVQPGTGVLFAHETDRLGTINTGTGEFTAIGGTYGVQPGSIGVQDLTDVRGLGFDPTTGTLYAIARRVD
ncbi:MAG: hypothetical protein KJO84_07545, partial [Acidimicrobiia bacterium]|nr:hypothetical protein [Acidimicrobiia bacterium]